MQALANPNKILLSLIILVEGFVSIAIEIITIRQLLPVAGGSVIVTSLVIGIFLLFLALGYKKGGSLSKDLKRKLRINFLIASLWFGVGLSYLFILNFFYFMQKIVGFTLIYPLIAYLLLVIAPLIYILGQTVPITMNMALFNKSAGKLGGDSLSLSTLGSFLGATMTAVILLHYLGVAWTIFINFLLLVSLTLLFVNNVKSFLLQLLISIIAISFVYKLNIETENKFFLLTDNYANYQILDNHNYNLNPDEKILSINNALSSHTNVNKEGFTYIEMIKKILFNDLNLSHANILVLGAGGFSLSAGNTYHNHFTYVDIDNQINKVAVPHFIDHINGNFIADDARHFLQSSAETYQAIIIDVFSNIRTVPAHLLTYEYMQQIQHKLSPNGTAIFNVIAKPTLADPYSKRVDNTIRMVFKNCMVIPQDYTDDIANILYVCRNTKNQTEKRIYTDNLNTATTDSFQWSRNY